MLVLLLGIVAGSVPVTKGAIITNVVRRNPDGNSGDTEPQIAPNPLNEDQPCYVDRAHQYNSIPAYLIGAEYVMTANDDKDNGSHELDVTLSEPVTLYLFLDNRLQGSGQGTGGRGVNPDLSGMPWVAAMGFTDTGDDIGIDEAGDGTINQWSSVFSKKVSAGKITLRGQPQGYGGNMYGVAAKGPQLKARDPDPPDGNQNVVTPLRQWTAGETAKFHDVYLGTSPTLGTADFKGRYSVAMYWHDSFVPGTTYYWRVDEVEADGVTVHTGDLWSFRAATLIAYSPSPPDGAKYVSIDADLSWTPGITGITHDVYFGPNQADVANGTGGTSKGNQPAKTYEPGTLQKDTVYYWRIDEVEVDKTTKHKGTVWSFKTAPNIPITDPNLLCWWKFDEGVGTTAVDWSGHDHHGTLEGNPQWVDGFAGGALQFGGDGDRVVDNAAAAYLNGLGAVTVCMWIKSDVTGTDRGFIDGEDPDGNDSVMTMRYDAAGSSFAGTNVAKMALTSDPGGEQQLESSSDIQTTEWQHVTMTWSGGGLIRFYINGVEDTPTGRNVPNNAGVTSGCTKLVIGQGGKDAGSGWDGLIDDVRIYNKVLTPEQIKQAMRGDPTLAWNPKPANKSLTDVERAAPLTWSPGEKAAQHDVYFGTDQTAVANATTASTGIYRGRQVAANYAPPEGLQWGGGPYYWRIDEYNTDGTLSAGRVWSFTVADYLIVDDFDDYTDDVGSRIFQTWRDGFGFSEPAPGYPGNGTGSAVGYAQAPFAEQTIVRGGKQSMPLEYNNSGATGKARYSETQREWASPLDWTKYSLKALTLYFYGAPANAAEQLYVALEDNAGHIKVVNHPDPEAVQGGAWQEWNIELTQFSGAGVNLKAIKRMYIGLGNRTSPKVGGTGTIFIDDIRLYPSRCVPSIDKPAADLSGDCIVDQADVDKLANLWLDSGLQITPVNPGTTGLVAQYPFNGSTNDAVGGHNGTASGTPAYAAGKIGQAILLDGVDDMVNVGAVGISGAAARTITGWAKAGATAAIPDWTNVFGFVGPAVDPRTDMSFDMERRGGQMQYCIHVYDWERNVVGLDLEWHHLAATYDGTTIRWYGDGRFVGSEARVLNTNDNVQMGKRGDNENYFPGRVDEVYIYNRALSDGQIAWLAGHTSMLSIPADLHQDGVINFKDFAKLADSWLEQVLWP
jgi:hypothetical protein